MLDIPKPTLKETRPVAEESKDQGVFRIGNAWTSMNRRRLLLITIVLALVAALAAAAWGLFFRPVTVQVSHPESNVAVQVFGLGTVEARVTSQVGFKVSGVLVNLQADVGDRVVKGAVLARLDDREQSAQLAMAKAAVEQTAANLETAKASVDKAQATYANAVRISDRQQDLVKSASTSIETAETAKTTQDAALADVNLANANVLVAQANISNAKAQQQLQTATLDFHTLTAPYDAVVTERQKELGSALGAGQPVFALIDPKSVWVLAYIDESKAGEIQVGDQAEIVLRSHPNERLPGRVARIEPESDPVNEERKIEVAFDQIPAYANLHEQAEAYVTTVQLPQALLVPEAAIVGLGKNQGTLWTVEAGHLQQRKVTLGHRLLDGRYEITSGVPADTKVVMQLSSGLRVGRAAKIATKITEEPSP
jgi:HlyD family secretion protein